MSNELNSKSKNVLQIIDEAFIGGEISSEDIARARDRGSREVFFRPFSSADNVGVVGVPLLAVERSLAEGQHSIVFELVRSGKGGKFETRQVQVE